MAINIFLVPQTLSSSSIDCAPFGDQENVFEFMVTFPDGDILARKSWCSWGKGGIDGGSITTKTAMNRDAKKRNQEKQRN